MTDLEMTKLCAEAMGYDDHWDGKIGPDGHITWIDCYNPLSDDAQAMALVKHMQLDISCTYKDGDPAGWIVFSGDGDGIDATHPDLNRAIVECVAKMVTARQPAPSA